MKSFKSFGALVRALERVVDELPVTYAAVVKKGALLVEAAAKESIGHYQPEVGPFVEWAVLADATLADKRSKGYADDRGDNPLLRTGEMRDSINSFSAGKEFLVGSSDPVLVWQERGTADARFPIPPRPVLGPALYKNAPVIVDMLGVSIEKTLAGMK